MDIGKGLFVVHADGYGFVHCKIRGEMLFVQSLGLAERFDRPSAETVAAKLKSRGFDPVHVLRTAE